MNLINEYNQNRVIKAGQLLRIVSSTRYPEYTGHCLKPGDIARVKYLVLYNCENCEEYSSCYSKVQLALENIEDTSIIGYSCNVNYEIIEQ